MCQRDQTPRDGRSPPTSSETAAASWCPAQTLSPAPASPSWPATLRPTAPTGRRQMPCVCGPGSDAAPCAAGGTSSPADSRRRGRRRRSARGWSRARPASARCASRANRPPRRARGLRRMSQPPGRPGSRWPRRRLCPRGGATPRGPRPRPHRRAAGCTSLRPSGARAGRRPGPCGRRCPPRTAGPTQRARRRCHAPGAPCAPNT
mmetsp:Transcript_106572/g.318477  ORF Transcript_106572/g.318477 Transcript_106572/m.318477 type:complete len:205 (-) Transcript_106572:1924-2538(-)